MSERTSPDAELLALRGLLPHQHALTLLARAFRTLDGLSIALVWVCIGTTRALPRLVDNASVSDPLVAIISLPLLLIVPRQLGLLLSHIAASLAGGRRVELDATESYVVTWLVGICLLVIGVAVLTGGLGVPAAFTAGGVLAVATAAGLFSAVRKATDEEAEDSWSFAALLRGGWPVVAALALVSAPLTIIRLNQPYPLQVGWGLFNYNYRILQFVESDHISIAPGLHTPVHATLLGTSGLATGAESFGLLWAIPILLYSTYGLGMLALARRMVGSSFLGLAALWVAVWVLSLSVFQHLHAAGMRGVLLAIWPWTLLLMQGRASELRGKPQDVVVHLFVALSAIAGVGLIRWFLPNAVQVLALLVLSSALLALVRSLPAGLRQSVGLVTVVGGALTFVHIIEGPLYFGVGMAFVLLLSWEPTSRRSRALIGGAFAAITAFIALQVSGLVTFDDPSMLSRLFLGSERANAIPIPFDQKLDLFVDGLPYVMLALIALSAVRLLVWPDDVHIAATATVALAVVLYFVPESGLHRVLGPAIPLVGLGVALELHWLARRLLALRWKEAPALWSAALVIVALVALTPTLTSPLRTQMGLSSHLGFPVPGAKSDFSNITVGEYEATKWIADHAPADWAIISDPVTMFFMEGLTFHPQVVQKRAWVAESEYSPEDSQRLRSLDATVFRAPTMDEAVEGMKVLTEDYPGFLLVISDRTLDWFLSPDNLFPLTKPRQRLQLDVAPLDSLCAYYEIEPCLSRFFTGEPFSVVYANRGVAALVLSQRLDDFSPSMESLKAAPEWRR